MQEPGAYYCIRLSPDGKRLAMTVDHGDKGREIEVYDIRRGSLTRLTFTAEVNLFPIWSPDGKYLVFEASSPTGYGLALVRTDGSGSLQRLAENVGTSNKNYKAFNQERTEATNQIANLINQSFDSRL